VLLDEVQYAPALFRHLKVRIDADRHRMGRFLMTGSQKFPLMRALSESLAGRCAVLELDTLSSRELLAALPSDAHGFPDRIWRGGFPELYRNPEMPPRDFYSSYVATYLERDVRLALRVGNLRDFERFLRACALRSGQLLNLSELARDVGIAGTTARDWLSVLEASGQVVLLEPWFGNLGKRMIKTPKLYLRDTGLLCFLLGMDSAAAVVRSPFLGAVWETYVLGQILRSRAATGSSAGLFFWRDAHSTEVDFVIEQDGRLRLVEAKWGETVDARKVVAPLRRVAELAGPRAAEEHWVACQTPHSYRLSDAPAIRVINAHRFDEWV
jgi:predicted AAA+ superfamily ATPase